MIRLVLILCLGLTAGFGQTKILSRNARDSQRSTPLLPVAAMLQAPALPSCASDSVSVADMAAGKCSCPAAEPGVETIVTFAWTGDQGQFKIAVRASRTFNWFSAKECHKYGLLWGLDADLNPIPLLKLPQSKWALNLFSMHFLKTLVEPLQALCLADEECKQGLPEVAEAADAKAAAAAAEAAAKAAAAAEALHPIQ